MYTSLVLRFIDERRSSEDDVIRIQPVLQKTVDGSSTILYNVNYLAKNHVKGPGCVKTNSMLTWNEFYNYITSCLELLLHDTCPFEYIQIDFPTMPSVLLSHEDLTENAIRSVLNQIYTYRMHWPTSSCCSCPTPKRSSHLFFEEDGLTVKQTTD